MNKCRPQGETALACAKSSPACTHELLRRNPTCQGKDNIVDCFSAEVLRPALEAAGYLVVVHNLETFVTSVRGRGRRAAPHGALELPFSPNACWHGMNRPRNASPCCSSQACRPPCTLLAAAAYVKNVPAIAKNKHACAAVRAVSGSCLALAAGGDCAHLLVLACSEAPASIPHERSFDRKK